MRRPLIHNPETYSLALVSPDDEHTPYYETFKVPVDLFLSCGAVWTQLNLCTVFWERPAWGIERNADENERIKKAYLLAFPNYDAPISKAWADKTLHDNQWVTNKAYFEIVAYKPILVDKIKDAFQKYGIRCIHGEDKFVSVIKN